MASGHGRLEPTEKTADDEVVGSRASARSRRSGFAASGRTNIVAPDVRQKDVLGIRRSGSSFGSQIKLKALDEEALHPANRRDAQRAPPARLGFVVVSRECAQTPFALAAKTARFSAEFAGGDGLENRRLRQCKISIAEVLISRTLSVRGEMAERLKAAVC